MGLGPTRIVYSHSVKHPTDIRYAQARGVDLIAFDNEEELVKMKSLHPNARYVIINTMKAMNKLTKIALQLLITQAIRCQLVNQTSI